MDYRPKGFTTTERPLIWKTSDGVVVPPGKGDGFKFWRINEHGEILRLTESYLTMPWTLVDGRERVMFSLYSTRRAALEAELAYEDARFASVHTDDERKALEEATGNG